MDTYAYRLQELSDTVERLFAVRPELLISLKVELPMFGMTRLAIDPVAWPALRALIDMVYIHVETRMCGRERVTVERQGRLSMHMHGLIYGEMFGGH